MYRPTTRVLTVLELLQAHARITGSELARRLEVNIRTVRRYVEILQDLGIPVEAERGRYGAYSLRPGFTLPPLMFSEDEAFAVTLGLLAVRRLGLAMAAPAVEGALAKVDRVLPRALRERVDSVQEALVFHPFPFPIRATNGAQPLNVGVAQLPQVPPIGATVMLFSTAVGQTRRAWLRYRSENGEETERTIDPYGVVYHTGVWYVVGYCHLRAGTRIFRLDRVLATAIEEKEASFTRPLGFDSLNYVLHSITSLPRSWKAVVRLATTLSEAQRQIPASLASLEETEAGIVMRCSVDDPTWMAGVLAGLECDFIVHEPPQVREALRYLSSRLLKMADAGRTEP